MGIFERSADIIKANLHEMIERFENPEVMLRQAVREMEEAIGKARQDIARLISDGTLMAKEVAEHQKQANEWNQRAVDCVQSGQEDQARRALAHKLGHESEIARLRVQVEDSQAHATLRREELDAMQAKLSEAQRRLGTLTARKRAAALQARTAELADMPDTTSDKFERLRQKVVRAEAEADALAAVSAQARRPPGAP